jgi:hypothetical protein
MNKFFTWYDTETLKHIVYFGDLYGNHDHWVKIAEHENQNVIIDLEIALSGESDA